LIYLVINFPVYPPEIFIEMPSNDLTVNSKCIEVDPNTLQVSVSSLKYWNTKTKIVQVLSEIVAAFSRNFPIYKRSSSSNNVNNINNGNNVNNMNQRKPSNENMYGLYSNPNVFQNYQHPPLYNNNNYNPGIPINKSDPNKENIDNINKETKEVSKEILNGNKEGTNKINDEVVRKMIIQELKDILAPKIREEIKVLKLQEEKIKKYKIEFSARNKILAESQAQNENLSSKFQGILSKVVDDISMISSELAELRLIDSKVEKENDISSKVQELLSRRDADIVKAFSAEFVLEDMLQLSKKMMEKMNFNDIVKMMRNLSRELFKIRFYKDKLMSRS